MINAKTALEVQAEGYRKDLAELDAETAPYEVQLANAKLLTAQKKLELIPIIQGIIEKEEQLLGLESSKTAYYTALLNQENEVAAKKQQMLPGLAELATVTRQHAALIPTQIELERQIAEEKVAQAEAKVEVSENDLERIDIEIDTENKNVEISAAKRDLADEQFDNEQELIALKINKEETYQNNLNDSYDTVAEDDRATASELISDKIKINEIKNDTRYGSESDTTSAEISSMISVNQPTVTRKRQRRIYRPPRH